MWVYIYMGCIYPKMSTCRDIFSYGHIIYMKGHDLGFLVMTWIVRRGMKAELLRV